MANQHWVPKFLLKKFSDGDGRVFRLDILTDEISKPPPRKAASRTGFYDFQVSGQTVSFERRLEKVETAAARVLTRVVDARSLAGLGSKDRKWIADFVATQSFRTEAFFMGLEAKPSRTAFGNQLNQLWDSSVILSGWIEQRRWALMVIESDQVFYLGDQPVVLQRTRNPADGSNLGFDVEGIGAFLPLSPKCALYMPCPSVSEEIIGRHNWAMALHRAVRRAVLMGNPGGEAELMVAQDTIRRTYELYRAFTTGSPIQATAEHIENLNYLQCSWAHSGVFSNRSDFAFAKRVFSENPQYRTTPRSRLLNMRMLVPDPTGS